MKPQRRKSVGRLVLVVCLIGGVWFLTVLARREKEAFLPPLQQLDQANLERPLPPKAFRRAFVRDKVLVVERGCRYATPPLVISRFQSRLPGDLRATRPEEVGTIVFIGSERAEEAGTYVPVDPTGRNTSRPAFYRYLDALVIDAGSWKVLDERTLTGYPPPPGDITNSPWPIENPFPELLTYLQGLPRS